MRRADASGSTGRTTTRPAAPLDDWSTPLLAHTKPWRVSVISSGPLIRTMRAACAQDDLDEAGVLVPPLGELGGERRRLDAGEVDDGAFGLRDDLRGDDDDVAVGQRRGAGDHRREVVPGGDLGQVRRRRRCAPRGHWRHRHGRTVAPSANMATHDRNGVSDLFDPVAVGAGARFTFTDITYHRAVDQGTVRIAFDRPEVRNAFRPHTVDELFAALDHARTSSDVGVVLLTGNGPSCRDGGWAFCSGGDQRIRGRDGYQYASGDDRRRPSTRRGPVACTSSSASG